MINTIKRAMKRPSTRKISATILAACLILLLAGCTTTPSKGFSERVPDDTYLGDYAPFQLDDCMAVVKDLTGVLKPCELSMYCVPRKNNIEVHFSYAIDQCALMFSLEQRTAFSDGIMAYMEAYNAGNLPERAPKKENAFSTGTVSESWGVFGPSRDADTTFFTSYEYLEPGKPYFLFQTAAAPEIDGEKDVYCPVIKLYFSPSQLELLYETTKQEALQAHIDELNDKAFGW